LTKAGGRHRKAILAKEAAQGRKIAGGDKGREERLAKKLARKGIWGKTANHSVV